MRRLAFEHIKGKLANAKPLKCRLLEQGQAIICEKVAYHYYHNAGKYHIFKSVFRYPNSRQETNPLKEQSEAKRHFVPVCNQGKR